MTAPPDFGATLLSPILAQFSLRYPDIRFDVRLTTAMVDLVAEGFDLAIRSRLGRFKSSTLTARRLGSASLGYYASPAYVARRGEPRRFADPRHDWVAFPPLLAHLRLPKDFRPRFKSDDFNMIRSLVRDGVGVGAMPVFVAAADVETGHLVPVLAGESIPASGGFFLVYPSSGQVPRKLIAFRDFLLERLKSRALG